MTLLWLACGALLLLVIGLLLWPLALTGNTFAAQRDFEAHDVASADNVRVFRQRLASLDASRDSGELDEVRYQASRTELERSLLEDTEDSHLRPLKPARAGLWLVPVIVSVVVGGAVYIYHRYGAAGDLELYAVRQEVLASNDTSNAHFINRFEAEAERQPDNPRVWATLFPLYRDSGRFDAAVASLNHLIALEGRSPDLVAELAQMTFFAAGRTLTPEVRALVAEVLNEDPRQPTIHGMLGFAAFQQGNYRKAIDHWRLAIAGFDDEESQKALRAAIKVAQERSGIASSDDSSSARPSSAAAFNRSADDMQNPLPAEAAIRVRVSLDDRLRKQVAADDTVFVLARDIDNRLPPLAIARLKVSDLPANVTLSDASAMAATATLSQVERASIVVRVSKAGVATPAPGDLYGESDTVAVRGGASVAAVIDRIVK